MKTLSLFCLSLLVLGAQENLLPLEKEALTEEGEADSIRDRIPAGAVLTKFSVPRYDKNNKLTSQLTAEKMTVDSAEVLVGEAIKLWLYDKDEALRTSASLEHARFLVEEEQLIGTGSIIVREKNDEFYARSEGGVFDLNTGQALMLGQTQTMLVMKSDKRTTMQSKTLLPFAAVIQLLVAAPPPELTDEQLAEFEKAIASPVVPESGIEEIQAEADQNSAGLDERLAEYLATVGKMELLLQVAAPAAKEADPEAEFEKLFEPHPDRIFITSSEGFYYDGTNYELAYLGNIVLEGKGVRMTCNKDIKVIFNPPPEKSDAEKKAEKGKGEEDAFSGLGQIGELKQLTANGDIIVRGLIDGKSFFLGGENALYDPAENQLTIRGDNLRMSVDGNAVRSDDKGASIVMTLNDDNTVKSIVPGKRGQWKMILKPEKKK